MMPEKYRYTFQDTGYSLKTRRHSGIGIPSINLTRSDEHVGFIMGIPIPVRRRPLNRDPESNSPHNAVPDKLSANGSYVFNAFSYTSVEPPVIG